jgi:8-oxo-dGTP diphosphatase
MINYVVGFMFSKDKQFVALIRKNRPAWQAGKLNGIGGKVEDGEMPREAMSREFEEETGVWTSLDEWTIRGRLESPESRVLILKAESDKVFEVQSPTDEKVNLWIMDGGVPHDSVPNLKVIVPALLLDDIEGIFLTYR